MSPNLDAVSTDDRKSPRTYLQQSAVLNAGAGRRAVVQVVNVSVHGMMVETHARFAAGRVVTIEIDGLGALPGKIAWVRDGHIGISFAIELTPAQMNSFD